MTPPLEGVLVLDLTRAVAGPMCTMLLADAGARVIKIEEPSGDETRHWGPPFVPEGSTYFLGLNRNKESVTADLKNGDDLALVQRIAARATIAVENFRPGVAGRLGLGYERLSADNPGLIYASISGFGQTGPESERPGYDLIVQAASGLMHTSGGKTSFPVADVLAALFAQQAILTALLRRQSTGQGAYIDVTLLESLLAAMSPLASAYLMAGVDPAPAGPAHANIVPYQVFRAADGQIAIGVTNERIWRRFCEALGRPGWLADPRFDGNENRNRHRTALLEMLEPVIASLAAGEWERRLGAAGVPCSAVRTVGAAIGSVENVWTLSNGLRTVGNPARLSGLAPRTGAPPALGADTARVREEFPPAPCENRQKHD